mgnify:CR=1 FL=1
MKICIPIKAKNIAEAKKQITRALRHADLIEIWLDDIWKFGAAEIRKIIKFCKVPVIAVCRSGNEKKRIEILKKAVLGGAKFVDIDLHTNKWSIQELKNICKKRGAKLIISRHIWDKTPELPILSGMFKSAKKLGADIVKIATQATNWSDNAVLFEFVSRVSSKSCKIIAIGMGERGKISRIGCPLLGSYLTYVALDEKSRTANGQLTVKEFLCLCK